MKRNFRRIINLDSVEKINVGYIMKNISDKKFEFWSLCNGKLWYSNIHRCCNSTCSEILPKIRSNLTWHSNMLKMKFLPEKHPRKAEIAAREERKQGKRQKTYFSSKKHGIVLIPRDRHYYSTGNPCSRCLPENPCSVLCGDER